MKLKVQKREVAGKKVKNLREENEVPAAVYGPKRESVNVKVNKKSFREVFKKTGYSELIDLEIEGEKKPVKVLIKEVQIHPVQDVIFSVSFYQVDEDKEISVDVPVVLTGESPAAKQKIGFLVNPVDTVLVHCLPANLPSTLEIDISGLEEIGDAVTISDLEIPKDVVLDSGINERMSVAYIAAKQKEIVEEEPEVEAVEGEEGELAEGEVPEGEASEAEAESSEGAEEAQD